MLNQIGVWLSGMKDMSSVEKSYYGLMFVTKMAVSFLMGTYVVYLMDKGMSLFDCHLINMSMFVALILFEVPTGVIADLFGRKISFVISGLIRGVALLIYAYAHSLPGFILGEVVYAFGATFSTGAFQAWMVDSVDEKSMKRIIPNGMMISRVAGMIGAGVGGCLMDIDLSLPWKVGACFYLLTAVLGFCIMPECAVKVKRQGSVLADFLKHSWQGVVFISENKTFRFIVLNGFIHAIALQIVNLEWQMLFEEIFTRKLYYGLLFSGISISLFIGAQWSKTFLLRVDSKKRLIVSQILIAVGVILSVWVKPAILVVLFFLWHEVFRGVFESIFQVYLHETIPPDKKHMRATLESYQKMGDNVGRIIGLLVGGMVVQAWGIFYSWVIAAGILILFAVVFLVNGHLKIWRK